jgi:hypothetical protein
MSKSESRRGNQVVLPVLLILAGVLVLAGNLGWLAWGSIWDLLDLWPVILIAIGVDLLTAGRYRWIVAAITIVVLALGMTGRVPFLGAGPGAAAETHDVQIPVEDADRAEIRIRVGVSELEVSALSGGSALVSGTVRTAEGETFAQDVQRRGGTADVELVSEHRGIGNIRGGGNRGWNLALAQDIPTDLTVNTGVGRSRLDLRGVALTGLRVDAGVGEMVASLPLPTEGSYQASFDTGVGATTVRVPEDAAVRVAIDTGLGGITARGGFDALGGDVYQTPGYANADERIEIRIDGGVGAITIERVD